ncbi:MAG: UbiA family prenyltransferase [Nitrospina sp.]|nr:UbiA family prenyltransferase [Nitrospina sp.]MBT3416196.1 UbiA family prenyltransferase [Nitrospina sp.]MBT3856534.1 UbiA family prenyltransferase [Nitrospina sp.]MBT4105588.1 UbiA family prenyltransferase [Nitrospina sp.]MBT4390240.1 UbiA family prenyltransferase [Nitrospina sp.]
MPTKLAIIFSDIKIQHTVFALPFAVMSAFLAAGGLPEMEKLVWIVVCMVGARSAAMAFNRIVDARFDKENPRTEDRALPSGKISVSNYALFLVASSALFIFSAWMLNSLAFYLSPVALAIVFFYSLTKRFTAFSHFWLGLAISIAPVGAWVAIREEISFASLLLGAAVVFWLIGFDILYACMDVEADRVNRLHSIPERFGIETALKMALASHMAMVVFLLVLLEPTVLLGGVYLTGVALVTGLLVYEHSLIKKDDLSKVNMAFFNVNGIISIGLMIFVVVDCVWV